MTLPDSAEAVNAHIESILEIQRGGHIRFCHSAENGHLMSVSSGPPNGYWGPWEPVPNYAGSLDAMAGAEKTLTSSQWNAYVNELDGLIEAEDQPERDFRWCTATAAQRAQAFLAIKAR